MKKLITTACLSAIATLGVHTSANAVNAANIFSQIGMSTNLTSGGSVHSQARSIYSLGGGMATAKGKRITLMAVDPPGFKAGCAGISWHFGGFSFISVQEIVEMIKAVARSAVGVVIDLAMQTLCPQCQAIMSQMRAMANTARGMAADSCRVAKGLGDMLKNTGIFGKENLKTECGTTSAASGQSDDTLSSFFTEACAQMKNVNATLDDAANTLNKFLSGGNKALADEGKKSVPDELVESTGNMTYKAVSSLGYADGLSKDIILSSIGMAIYPAKTATDCSGDLGLISPTASADYANLPASEVASVATAQSGTADTSATNVESPETLVTGDTPGGVADVAAEKTTKAASLLNATDSKTSRLVCWAPPLIEGGVAVGIRLVCGFNPKADLDKFAATWAPLLQPGTDTTVAAEEFKRTLSSSEFGKMCNLSQSATVDLINDEASNLKLYKCDKECHKPEVIKLNDALQAGINDKYTGVAWYVMDALYRGVAKVKNGTEALDPDTVGILTIADYPLFRIMNLAAVYGSTATKMLEAYSAKIATQHVDTTLTRLLRVGALPHVTMKDQKGLGRNEVLSLREQIDRLNDNIGTMNTRISSSLAEKQALIDQINQLNKAIQSDIISTGLANNNDLAISIKNQIINAPSNTPAAAATTP